jgi:hypothetical protein
MGTTNAVVLAAASLAMTACATHYNFTTEEQVIDAASVASAASFAFAPEDPLEPAIPDPAAGEEVRAALGKELEARGWTLAARDDADVVVSYEIGATSGASMISDAYPGHYSTFIADSAREMNYVDQALVVSLASGPSGADIWRGQAVARLYSPMGEARGAVIDQAVARIIAQLDDNL